MPHKRTPPPILALTLALALLVCPRPAQGAQSAPFPDLPLRLTAEQAAGLGIAPGVVTKSSLSKIPAEAVVLLVVGYFCPPCHAEMPRIAALCQRLQARGLGGRIRLVAVAAGDDQNLAAKFQAKHPGLCFPIVPDPDLALHKKLGSPAIPALYVLTRHKGGLRLVSSRQGEFREDPDAFLDALLREVSGPKAGPRAAPRP